MRREREANLVSVILPAAGRGKRMKAGINKVFLELLSEPILCHTLRAFAALPEVQELIVVTGRDEVEPLRRLLANRTVLGLAEASKSIKVVEGGSERQYSVWNGLKASSAESDVVLVHDAARPLVSRATIEAVIGGLHLGKAPDWALDETLASLAKYGVARLSPGHCTGEAGFDRLQKDFPGQTTITGAGMRLTF